MEAVYLRLTRSEEYHPACADTHFLSVKSEAAAALFDIQYMVVEPTVHAPAAAVDYTQPLYPAAVQRQVFVRHAFGGDAVVVVDNQNDTTSKQILAFVSYLIHIALANENNFHTIKNYIIHLRDCQ